METSKIEIMLKALELGSLTKVAAEYEYTPSAVSQMLSSLENEVGTRLVNRTHTGIEVAEGKENLIELFRDLIKVKKQIMLMASDGGKGKKTVTIATYSSISKHILPIAIKRYKDICPDIDINIIVSDDLDNVYKRGLADFCFGERIKSDGAKWDEMIKDPFVAILPPSYKSGSDAVSIEELFKNKFIMARDRNIRTYIRKYAKEDITSVNSNDDSSIIELVRAEMGVSILSRLAVLGASDIQIRSLDAPIFRRLGFIYDKNVLTQNKNVAQFMDFLKEYIEKM